ncbi:MAG: YggS family pyridoxal phosphate-dependent enzyme [Deltaproteobacteria bacterium]|nr:YggS family pyridoxal phosphate-dependent enzyme [Deltaproteobacteria bacterium]
MVPGSPLAESFQHIPHNLARVREDMAEAARRAGRPPHDITLVAVSKTHPAQAVLAAWQAGQRVFGENRVQEALEKQTALAGNVPDLEWHLVGHLQSNKARLVPGRFALLHSLDSAKLAQALNRQTENIPPQNNPGIPAKRLRVLLQVNTGGEDTKSGARSLEDLKALAAAAAECPGLDVRGLMTLPPPDLGEAPTRKLFAQVREACELIRGEFGLTECRELSMGMSHDFAWAIQEGSTLIRVGTAIFGHREG